MKHLSLFFYAVLFMNIAAFSQDYDTPVGYMDVINKQSENISKKFMSYASASAHGKKARKVENLRNKLMDEVQEARMNIASMPAFKGDKAYRDTSVNFMKLYYNVLNEDYSKIINMEDIAEQSYDDMEAYLMAQEMVSKKLEEGNRKMQEAQRVFAEKNNVHLTEASSELGDKMKQVHAVDAYYHQVYLIFFKPYKQEYYMLEALGKNNITGIEQNKNSLLKYAQDGLQKLEAIKPFEGDNSIVDACRSMLKFYIREVNENMSTVSEYYLTKERFETIKKEYDRKDEHSKADVDAYNKSVKEINAASEAYNKTSQAFNGMRDESFNDWNKSVNAFFDEHTPHYK